MWVKCVVFVKKRLINSIFWLEIFVCVLNIWNITILKKIIQSPKHIFKSNVNLIIPKTFHKILFFSSNFGYSNFRHFVIFCGIMQFFALTILFVRHFVKWDISFHKPFSQLVKGLFSLSVLLFSILFYCREPRYSRANSVILASTINGFNFGG